MLGIPPYLVVVGLVVAVVGLAGVNELRQLLCRRRNRKRVGAVVILAAQTTLRPAARAVLAVTVIWVVGMAVSGSLQLTGAASALSQQAVVGATAGSVLLMVPKRVNAHQARVGFNRSQHEDFARWEAELRSKPSS